MNCLFFKREALYSLAAHLFNKKYC